MRKHIGLLFLAVLGWSCLCNAQQPAAKQPAAAVAAASVTPAAVSTAKPAITATAAALPPASTKAAATLPAAKPAASPSLTTTATTATPAVVVGVVSKPAASSGAAVVLKPTSTAPAVVLKPTSTAPAVVLKPTSTAPAKPAAVATPAASSAAAPPPFIFKQPGATKTLKIGCAAPFEGDKASVGAAVVASLEMAIKAKAPTLLPGVNVNLTCLNTKCVDIPAYMAVTRFAEEKADAMIGEICSGASVAAAGVAQAKKLPIISPSSTSPTLSSIDYFFRTVPSDRYQGVAAADLVFSNGGRNAGLIYEDSSYAYGLGFNFIAGFTKLGGSVPVVYQFKTQQGNPEVAVARLKQGVKDKKLDSVFIATNNLTFVAEVLVLAKSAGLSNLKFYGGDSQADSTLFQRVAGRPSVLGELTASSPSFGTDAFVNEFKKYTNNKVPYSPFAAHAYDAMEALLRAYKAAAAPKDGPAIKAALQQQKFEGVSGPIEFDQFGDLVPKDKTYVFSRFNMSTGAVQVKGFI